MPGVTLVLNMAAYKTQDSPKADQFAAAPPYSASPPQRLCEIMLRFLPQTVEELRLTRVTVVMLVLYSHTSKWMREYICPH